MNVLPRILFTAKCQDDCAKKKTESKFYRRRVVSDWIIVCNLNTYNYFQSSESHGNFTMAKSKRYDSIEMFWSLEQSNRSNITKKNIYILHRCFDLPAYKSFEGNDEENIVCDLCKEHEDDVIYFGKMISFPSFSVHHFCCVSKFSIPFSDFIGSPYFINRNKIVWCVLDCQCQFASKRWWRKRFLWLSLEWCAVRNQKTRKIGDFSDNFDGFHFTHVHNNFEFWHDW